MRFIFSFFLFLVSSYLIITSFSNQQFENFFSFKHLPDLNIFDKNNIPKLPTDFKVASIPDLLTKNAEYQKAVAVDATENHTTDNPLSALVNIYCNFVTKDTIRTTTGSGFFIHSSGVILTNAHVAQYLLLGETDFLGDAECFVRAGDPAKPEYKAELLYISPAWIVKNAVSVNSPHPTGTGERDYALLFVTESITEKSLPEKFPALNINTELLPVTLKDSKVLAAGYPALENTSENFGSVLFPLSATTSITNLYTFDSNYADVISLQGSEVGHGGSSGGPVIDDKQVIAMITTRGDDLMDGNGSLRAITISHINRTIEEETGLNLEKNLRGNLKERTKIFSGILTPFLVNILNSTPETSEENL